MPNLTIDFLEKNGHLEKMNSIAKPFNFIVINENGMVSVRQDCYDFYNTGISTLSDYDDMCNYVVKKFAVEFSGFGSQDKADFEDFIYNGIVNAKSCVDALNEYLYCLSFEGMSCEECSESDLGKGYLYNNRCKTCQHFRRDCSYIH